MWCVRIVGTYLCTQVWGMGLTAAWGCMIAHNLTLFVLFGISYLRGKWMPGETPEKIKPAPPSGEPA